MVSSKIESELAVKADNHLNPTQTISQTPGDSMAIRPAVPIAVIGVACRLPGGVNSSSTLWNMLASGKSGQCDIPSSRFNIDAFYHPKGAERPGSMNTKGGYFLQENIRTFDNEFFGINNLEATYMDPQQRKLLEVVFECLETAGIPLDKISGSNTGCYVANFTVDYQTMQTKDPEYLRRYSATGMGTTILGNRISHAFNLLGPSLVLDTACSSSLYCLHVACTALESGECDGAIVAGANLIQSPEQHLGTMKAGVLSATSTCHTFDASADGYGRADGIGALYLKRLDNAIRDGDPIRSVIRATATNANGKTTGITLPSANGQEAVIRKAYQKANLTMEKTAFVECHGTGTPVGDVIEVEALSRVFKRPPEQPLLIGSVKTNLGHAEAASGISSIIKTTLALEKSLIPATVGVKRINPDIQNDEWRVEVVKSLTSWPAGVINGFQSSVPPTRRAGVNSFGYGGANAHAILENADPHVPDHYNDAGRTADILGLREFFLLPVSAVTQDSLDTRTEDLIKIDWKGVSLYDLAYTLGLRRSHFAKRGFWIVDRKTWDHGLGTLPLRTTTSPAVERLGSYAFIFTGQGAQWPGMCKELFKEFPIFRKAISEMDHVLRSLPHAPLWSLQETILETDSISLINDPTRAQPACTAIQVALVQLLASWDLMPSAVLGHSSGEIAAAFAAGHLSSGEAIAVAYYRGYVGQHLSQGAMIAVGLSYDTAIEEISLVSLEDHVKVACINSPESVTLSGDLFAIDKILELLETRKVFAKKLNTGGRAYHSHHMLSVGQEYQSLLDRALPSLDLSSKLPTGAIFVSSVTTDVQSSNFSSAYWRSNLESPVMFAGAIEELSRSGAYHLIELGPHSALELPIKQICLNLGLSEQKFQYSTAISRYKNSVESVLNLVGSLWLHGHAITFDKINGLSHPGKKNLQSSNYEVLHHLPSYPWHYKETLWNECRVSSDFRDRRYLRHELLGSQVPGGNGLAMMWRNVLRVHDVPWLLDHKLEETTVYPCACYISMAIEAVIQASGSDFTTKPTFYLESVNMLAALTLSTEPAAEIELFTALGRATITSTLKSKDWWEFTISSFRAGSSTTHATGLVRLQSSPQNLIPKIQAPKESLESSAPRVWYEKLAKEGLNFGRTFQTIEELQISRMKSMPYCTSKVPLLRNLDEGYELYIPYAIHPITIDAMLQSAIIATTYGNSKNLRAKVPTRIRNAIIKTPEMGYTAKANIHSKAEVIGFGAAEIVSELIESGDNVCARLEKVKLAPYNVVDQIDLAEKRHPMLRVLWKPDIYGLGLPKAEDLSTYLDNFVTEAHSDNADEGLLKLRACLSLLSHKNPRLHILELGNSVGDITHATLDLLRAGSSFKRFASYTTGKITESGELLGASAKLGNEKYSNPSLIVGESYDLIILPFLPTTKIYLNDNLHSMIGLLKRGGLLLALSTSSPEALTDELKLEVVQCELHTYAGHVVLARPLLPDQDSQNLVERQCIVIDRDLREYSAVATQSLSRIIQRPVTRFALCEVTKNIISGAIVFSLLESEQPLLSTLTNEEMAYVKTITDNASTIVWVTAGNLLEGKNPDFALASGLSRALVLEQPATSFFTFDVDNVKSDIQQTMKHLVAVVKQSGNSIDLEFCQRRGVVHVSRFVPDDALNDMFKQRQGLETVEMSLKDAAPAKLGITSPGRFDSIHFEQQELQKCLGTNCVQVGVKAVGLNAKDFYVLAGKVDTKGASCTLEFSGVIEKVGSAVSSLTPGDRVVVMAPGHFKTSEIVPEWACQKLRDKEQYSTLSTLSVVFATALYALHHRARIQPHETVLIHSGAGGVGNAAIQIAKLAGAKVFTTVSTEAKKDFLVKTFQINPAHIFSSKDASFLTDVLQATNGHGVDVVLNSLAGELLHAGWRCCAPFGRFVEIGKLDLTDSGQLEMDQFLKNVTFTAFDLSYLYNTDKSSHHAMWTRLHADALTLYRERKITNIEPLEVFDVSDLTQALRRFSSRNRIGKVSISLMDPGSILRVRPLQFSTILSPLKTYVMIGCLGGLGRSISKWMMSRGARKFVFLSRSGLKKEPARRLVEDLNQHEVKCKVICGDVCSKNDVNELVNEVDGPIGGVVQAAMGLNEGLFTGMPNKHWHTGIDPKVQGTWNLHNAIKGKDSELDFFLMTSSISGSVGTATESNYCAANYFLDIFARYRRSLGLSAISIGLGMISEVGYVHENPEIESLLLRKGIQAINEDELLQIIDAALCSNVIIPHVYDQHAHSHILTGLEPWGLKKLRKMGWEGTNPTLNDPRAAVLAGVLDGQSNLSLKVQDGNLFDSVIQAIVKGIPLFDAVLEHVVKRFGNLILVAPSQVEVFKPLADYGMDSMIAAEFRTWFFQAFKVDIPFLDLLNKSVTVRSLSETVYNTVNSSQIKEEKSSQ